MDQEVAIVGTRGKSATGRDSRDNFADDGQAAPSRKRQTPLIRSGLPPVDDGLAAWLVDSAWRIDSSRLTTLIGTAMLCLNSLATAFKSCFALSAAVSVERGMATRAVRSAGP